LTNGYGNCYTARLATKNTKPLCGTSGVTGTAQDTLKMCTMILTLKK